MYKFRYSLNDDDYLELNKFHLSNSPVNKRALFFLRLTVPVILAIWFLLSLLNPENQTMATTRLVIYFSGSVLWVFLVKPLRMASVKRNIRIMKKHGKLPYAKDASIEFYDDHFIQTTPDTETKMKYSSIEKVAKGDLAIYIYLNTIQACIIPLCVFASAERVDEFYDFIQQKAAAYKTGTMGTTI